MNLGQLIKLLKMNADVLLLLFSSLDLVSVP